MTSTHFGIRIVSEAPASVANTTTNNAPGSPSRLPSTYSTAAAMPPQISVPPMRPNVVSREFTRTRSIPGGITRGVTALRSTLKDFESTIIPSAQGYNTQDG